jgi:hypothetical protein
MFESSYIPRWVGYQNNRWVGTERYDLIAPITGAPNPNDYPFKKYFLESNAPVYENTPNFFAPGPKNVEVKIKIAIQKGNLYDLSGIEKSRDKPLLVVKLSDGTYNVITFNQNLILTEDDLEKYRIPIMINGLEMKKIDFNKQKSVDAATLTTTIKFDQDGYTLPRGIGDPENLQYNRGQIYFLIKKQANPDGTAINPENYSRILGAEIISFDQLMAKNVFEKPGGSWRIKEDAPYMKDKVSITLLESFQHSSYIGIGSTNQSLFSKGTSIDIDNISPALLQQRSDDLSGKNRYKQVFVFRGLPYSFGQLNFNDHFFCRV